MKFITTRRKFLGILSSMLAWHSLPTFAQDNNPPPRRKKGGQGGGGGGGRGRRDAQDYVLPPELAAFSWLSLVLGRVTDKSVTVSAVAKENIEGFFEYGTAPGNYSNKTELLKFPATNRLRPPLRIFSPTRNIFTGCNFASRAKPISRRGLNANFTRNELPAALLRLPFKAIRIRNVRR